MNPFQMFDSVTKSQCLTFVGRLVKQAEKWPLPKGGHVIHATLAVDPLVKGADTLFLNLNIWYDPDWPEKYQPKDLIKVEGQLQLRLVDGETVVGFTVYESHLLLRRKNDSIK